MHMDWTPVKLYPRPLPWYSIYDWLIGVKCQFSTVYMIRLRSASGLKSTSTRVFLGLNIYSTHQQNHNIHILLTYVRLRSTSIPQIHVWFIRHRHLYLGSMFFFQIFKSATNSQIYGWFSLSQIDVQWRHWHMT
jgi:hypothetical protein